MNEPRKKRIAYLKRKENGNHLKPMLLEKINTKGFANHLDAFIDQETSYELYDHFKKLANLPKEVCLRDVNKKDIIDTLESLDKSDWGERGYLFLHHSLDVGSFEVELNFVLSHLFDLCQSLDGDSIYYLNKASKHAIYFDYSENNIDPDKCFDLDIW